MMSHNHPGTVTEIGERELIRLITPFLAPPVDSAGNIGVADDCAERMFPTQPGRTVVTTDLLVAGNHFLDSGGTDWFGLGIKAVASNLSDLASAGATPDSLFVTLAIPGTTPVSHVLELYRGMKYAADQHQTVIAGGDTASSPVFTIGVTALGYLPAKQPPSLRSNLRPGDSLYVTGRLGGSRAGLHCLLHSNHCKVLAEDLRGNLLQRHLQPEPRVQEGQQIAGSGNRVAMIDISDSLANEARLLAEASNVKVILTLDNLPLYRGLADFCYTLDFGSPSIYALFSGEEYELLFGMPPRQLADLIGNGWNGIEITEVGKVVEGEPGLEVHRNGKPVDIPDETFSHFRPSSNV